MPVYAVDSPDSSVIIDDNSSTSTDSSNPNVTLENDLPLEHYTVWSAQRMRRDHNFDKQLGNHHLLLMVSGSVAAIKLFPVC
jgi:hypothetical protein